MTLVTKGEKRKSRSPPKDPGSACYSLFGEGRGKRWVEEVLGLSIEIVRRPAKLLPEKVAGVWAAEWAKEGVKPDWEKLLPRRRFQILPRRWVVERTFSWLSQNRRMSKDYERLCATAEAFVYVAMTRLMVRRLAHA